MSFNIAPNPALEARLEKLKSSDIFKGPSRSLNLEEPPEADPNFIRSDEFRDRFTEKDDVSNNNNNRSYEPPPIVSTSFNFPSQRPTAQQQAEMMITERQTNDRMQRQQIFGPPSIPPPRRFISRSKNIQIQQEQQQQQQQERLELERKERELRELRRKQLEEEKQRQIEELESKRKQQEQEDQRIRQIHRGLPPFLYTKLGDETLKLEKHPTNVFEYWVDRSGSKGIAKLIGDNPFRFVWISQDQTDPKKSREMYRDESVPFNQRPLFIALQEIPPVVKKPFVVEPELEIPKQIFTLEERERLLTKAPIIVTTKRERESSPDVPIELSIVPMLKEQEEELTKKKQRLQVLDQRLRDPILMQREYEDIETQLQILQEQIIIQTQLVDNMRAKWKQHKQLIANEKVRAYREMMQKEVEREDDNERLVDAMQALKKIKDEAKKVEREKIVRDPKKLTKDYKNELTDLKKEITLLNKTQKKLEVLKEIENVANNIFRTSQKRTFVEFQVHFPNDFMEYMKKKGAPVRPGKTTSSYDQLTRDEQIAALTIYLCGEDKVLGIHEPGYVEEVLGLDNKYCKIQIKNE